MNEARRAVAEQVSLPAGTRIAWAGQFEHYERAKDRLLLVVPLTIALVALLLFLNTGSLVETGIVLLAVPFSLIGAFWLLWALGYNLSVGVWVGIIALAGLDAQTGVVMLLYLTLAHGERAARGELRSERDLEDAIVEGAARRIRPKLMTVVAMTAGLLPLLWSSGSGADVMKRIAAPMVGGLASSFALELLVYPALFALWKRRSLPGVILPFQMDGVPGGASGDQAAHDLRLRNDVGNPHLLVSQPLRPPEQMGHYGPIVIDRLTRSRGVGPRIRGRAVDWSFLHPHTIFRKLKAQPGYFNRQKQTLASLSRARTSRSRTASTGRRCAWTPPTFPTSRVPRIRSSSTARPERQLDGALRTWRTRPAAFVRPDQRLDGVSVGSETERTTSAT